MARKNSNAKDSELEELNAYEVIVSKSGWKSQPIAMNICRNFLQNMEIERKVGN